MTLFSAVDMKHIQSQPEGDAEVQTLSTETCCSRAAHFVVPQHVQRGRSDFLFTAAAQ